MMVRHLFALLLSLPMLAAGASPVSATDPAVDPAAMEEAMALAQPGEEHGFLAGLAGEWTALVMMYVEPGSDPIEMPAETSAEMILGGRFLRQRGTGTMMGEPIESLTFLGFDRRHGTYTLVGFDTGGTYYITAQGGFQEDGTLVLVGHDDNPPLGTQDYEFRMRFSGDDEFHTELHMSLNGSEMFKMVEWTSTRK